MKRYLTAVMIILTTSILAAAQTPLQISQIFNGTYASDPAVTETMMSGNHDFLKRHKLSLFTTFKGPASKYAQIVEPLVLKDGANAIGRNIRYKDGVLTYAYFMLQPIEEDGKTINRYIYYINGQPQKGKNIMVLYFEGRLRQNEANALIKAMSKN